MKPQTYRTCDRCGIVVALLHDGRPFPHPKVDNTDWCEGAHRPGFSSEDPTTLEEHRARHQQLYRGVRELVEDWIQQTNPPPGQPQTNSFRTAKLTDFMAWCKRQSDVPDHDDVGPHRA